MVARNNDIKFQVCICGHFANGKDCFDGQTVKTRSVYDLVVKKIGKDNVTIIDTDGWQKHPLKILKKSVDKSRKSKNMILLPARRGVKVFIPLFVHIKKRYRFKLHYVVIGGWLFEAIKNNIFLKRNLKKVDAIYFENKKTIKQFNRIGFDNLFYMPNFKDLIKSKKVRENVEDNVLRCCVFSRVEKEKGVLDAIDVVKKYNKYNDDKIFLDIYGKVKDEFMNEFENAVANDDFIKYKGTVRPSESVEIIEQYDLLLLPTKYKTEGIPGTIIDAYFAGTPVLASKWENFKEVVDDGKTGFGYEFDNKNDFYDKIAELAKDKKKLVEMSKNCLTKAEKYSPINVSSVLMKNMRF